MARTKAHPNQIFPDVVQRVGSAALLRAADFNTTANNIFIASLDGGLFQRDAADTSSAENGGSYCGTIIRSVDYATAGVWKRVLSAPGNFNIKWFGAKGDDPLFDDYPAIQATLAVAKTFTGQKLGGAAVYIPPGSFFLSQRASVNLGLDQDDGSQSITVYGDGSNVSMLWAAPTNTTGCLFLTSQGTSETFEVRDIGFISTLEEDAPTNNGTALEVACEIDRGEPGFGLHKKYSVVCRNLYVGCYVERSGDIPERAFFGNFLRGIYIRNKWWPIVDTVKINGSSLPYDGGNNPIYTKTGRENGILIYDCYGPRINNVELDGYYSVGVELRSQQSGDVGDQDWEGYSLTDSAIVGCDVGFYVNRDPANIANAIWEPGGSIIGTHFANHKYNAWIRASRQFVIQSCLFFTPDGRGPVNFTGVCPSIFLHACSDATIAGNQFLEGGFYVDDNNTAAGIYGLYKLNAQVTGNRFHHGGVALYTDASCIGEVTASDSVFDGSDLGLPTFKKQVDRGHILSMQYWENSPLTGISQDIFEANYQGSGPSVKKVLRAYRDDYASNPTAQIAEQQVDGRTTTGALSFASSIRTDWISNVNGTETANWKVFVKNFGTATQALSLKMDNLGVSNSTVVECVMNVGGSAVYKTILVGAADSAGAGFRALRIAN